MVVYTLAGREREYVHALVAQAQQVAHQLQGALALIQAREGLDANLRFNTTALSFESQSDHIEEQPEGQD